MNTIGKFTSRTLFSNCCFLLLQKKNFLIILRLQMQALTKQLIYLQHQLPLMAAVQPIRKITSAVIDGEKFQGHRGTTWLTGG